jgi:hypothetical protein
MTFTMLEGGAVVLTLLIAMEMRRQRRSWRTVLLSAVTVLATFTAMIMMWRGR